MHVKMEKGEKEPKVGRKQGVVGSEKPGAGGGILSRRERQKREGREPRIAVETPADMLCCMFVTCIKIPKDTLFIVHPPP